MPAIVTDKFRIHNAEQFFEAFSETSNTIIYFYIGGPGEFQNDLNPPTPSGTTANIEYTPWADMMALKRVQTTDTSHVVPRYNWTSGTVYTAYDDKTTVLSTDKFFVMTDEYNVYKCISNNNNAASTVKPTGTTPTGTLSTGDGYIWKYMYTIRTSEVLKYVTPNYIPAKLLGSDDGSDQWDVQQNAVAGAIHRIKITNGGTGYGSAPSVIINGDGTGAAATATVSGGAVTAITMNTVGSNYNNAVITFSGGGGSNAAATAIISPRGGHGANPVEELGGMYVLVNARLDGNESQKFTTANDFRKIGLVRDPTTFGTTTRATASTYRQTYRYTVTGVTGTFVVDETLSLGSNTATLVEWDTANNYLYTTLPLPRAFISGGTLTGGSSGATATISAIANAEVQPYSGDVIYVENRIPIHRSNDQIEDVKLIVEF